MNTDETKNNITIDPVNSNSRFNKQVGVAYNTEKGTAAHSDIRKQQEQVVRKSNDFQPPNLLGFQVAQGMDTTNQ